MFPQALIKINTFPRDTVSVFEMIKSEVVAKTEKFKDVIVEKFKCFE